MSESLAGLRVHSALLLLVSVQMGVEPRAENKCNVTGTSLFGHPASQSYSCRMLAHGRSSECCKSAEQFQLEFCLNAFAKL